MYLVLQYSLKSTICPRTVSLGEKTLLILFVDGGEFIKNIPKYTKCAITYFGRIVTPVIVSSTTEYRPLSLTDLIPLSASVTCSLVAVIFTIAISIWSTMLSNS